MAMSVVSGSRRAQIDCQLPFPKTEKLERPTSLRLFVVSDLFAFSNFPKISQFSRVIVVILLKV